MSAGSYYDQAEQAAENGVELCSHPEDERFVHDYGRAGYLGVPRGRRVLCSGCGLDLGPAASKVASR